MWTWPQFPAASPQRVGDARAVVLHCAPALLIAVGALLKGGTSVLGQGENQSCKWQCLNSFLLVCPAAGCATQRRVDALCPDLGGDPRQPSRQRGGGGGGALGIAGQEQRPPEQQLPPPSAPVFGVTSVLLWLLMPVYMPVLLKAFHVNHTALHKAENIQSIFILYISVWKVRKKRQINPLWV